MIIRINEDSVVKPQDTKYAVIQVNSSLPFIEDAVKKACEDFCKMNTRHTITISYRDDIIPIGLKVSDSKSEEEAT